LPLLNQVETIGPSSRDLVSLRLGTCQYYFSTSQVLASTLSRCPELVNVKRSSSGPSSLDVLLFTLRSKVLCPFDTVLSSFRSFLLSFSPGRRTTSTSHCGAQGQLPSNSDSRRKTCISIIRTLPVLHHLSVSRRGKGMSSPLLRSSGDVAVPRKLRWAAPGATQCNQNYDYLVCCLSTYILAI
jgi:hypothetical protein